MLKNRYLINIKTKPIGKYYNSKWNKSNHAWNVIVDNNYNCIYYLPKEINNKKIKNIFRIMIPKNIFDKCWAINIDKNINEFKKEKMLKSILEPYNIDDNRL